MKLRIKPLTALSAVSVLGITSLIALVLGARAVSGGTLDSLGMMGLSRMSRTLPDSLLEPAIPPANLNAPPDAERGRRFMLNRSMLKVGIPVRALPALKLSALGPSDPVSGVQGREGLNRLLPTSAAGKRVDGVPAMLETCLLCHTGALRGQLVVGLGNTFLDTTSPLETSPLDEEVLAGLKLNPEETQVLANWRSYFNDVRPYALSSTPGTVAALYFTGYFFSRRDAVTFEWLDKPLYPMLNTPNPDTDVPAWWLLRKKSALYYGGELTGDFNRSIMQFMSPPGNTLADLKAQEADFRDILAWLKDLRPPPFPGKVDASLASHGQTIFEDKCSKCHGTYGEDWEYDSEIVSLEKVGTDPARANFMRDLPFAEHYNKTWFGEHSTMAATGGYIAPPLDGIWATAPYLHNGSVPTLDAVLDPDLRPRYFVRSRDSRTYSLERVGWEVETLDHGQAQEVDPERRRQIYDTTLFGKSNQGHTFAAKLSPDNKRALLEYLKTL